jgi:hypothetical protein
VSEVVVRTKETVKRVRERAHLLGFVAACAEVPEGVLEELQAPDFSLTEASGQRLGIELTEFFKDDVDESGSRLKTQENLQEKVTFRAMQRYAVMGLPSVIVSIFWASYDDIVPGRVDELAGELATVVAAHLPAGPSGSAEVEQTGLPGSPLPDEVNTLHIYRIPEMDENEWNSLRAGYIPKIASGEIQRLIDKKERRVSEYRKACPVLWLVIVAEGLAPSSFGDLERAVRETRYRSSFDKVFFFRLFDKEAVALLLER